MAPSGPLVEMFQLPKDWDLLGSGKNRYQVGFENEYLILDTSSDVLTVLVYSCEVDIRQMSELASWSFIRKVNINGHDGFVHMHPGGFRKLLAWYCPSADLTFLITRPL
jgi:hypothetical protein